MLKRYYVMISVLVMLIMCGIFCACAEEQETPPDTVENYYTVRYLSGEGGTIDGNRTQTVLSGEATEAVTAVPKTGYRFIKWSDEITTETRKDESITSNLSITAYFERLTIELNYSAGENGKIEGNCSQTFVYGWYPTAVTAVPDEGYIFKEWSDGVTTPSRHDKNAAENIDVTAYFERETFEVSYEADENGTIEGNATQTIYYGETTETVTAVPNEGYRFVRWSDGGKQAQRSDGDIVSARKFTAYFERIINKYYYNIADCYPYQSMNVEYGELDSHQFLVPQREHYTFDGWMLGTTKVTDDTGNILVGNEFFDIEEREFRAKWIADAKYTYKILIVYVTELSGDFKIASEENGGILHIDYKMSDIEREMCHMTTRQVKRWFDSMLDGLVDFQVDEYYTQIPLTRKNIQGSAGGYHLFADKIPEVKELLDDYQHIAVSLSFFNYDTVYENETKYWNLLNNGAGCATVKYSCIGRDKSWRALIGSYITPEFFLNEENWDGAANGSFHTQRSSLVSYTVETYIHEFIHGIEIWLGTYNYHRAKAVARENSQVEDGYGVSGVDLNKLYLLNLMPIEGKPVGIPYEYWKGDVVTVQYVTNGGGYVGYVPVAGIPISPSTPQQGVIISTNSRPVIAKPSAGYRFVGWSDGVTTATRFETNVQSDITVNANFELIDFEIRYEATEGGYVDGEIVQYFHIYEGGGSTVIARAYEGYRFVGWSDGYERYFRSEFVDALNYDLFDENNRLILTAIFEKIE